MIKIEPIKAAPKKGRPRPIKVGDKVTGFPDGLEHTIVAVVKKGRPRIENKGKSFEATKPWLKEGMSRRTWYSRREERRKEKNR